MMSKVDKCDLCGRVEDGECGRSPEGAYQWTRITVEIRTSSNKKA